MTEQAITDSIAAFLSNSKARLHSFKMCLGTRIKHWKQTKKCLENSFQNLKVLTYCRSTTSWLRRCEFLNTLTFCLSDDHCRVKLSLLESQPHSDYINASYVPVSKAMGWSRLLIIQSIHLLDSNSPRFNQKYSQSNSNQPLITVVISYKCRVSQSSLFIFQYLVQLSIQLKNM